MEDWILLIDGNQGIYIPQIFAHKEYRIEGGMQDADKAALRSHPGLSEYWDTWAGVLDNVTLIDDDGKRYTLYQDGALWAVPEGFDWDTVA